MITTLAVIAIAFYWMLRETDYLRIRLLIGSEKIATPVEYITWDMCLAKYGNHFLSCGVDEPLCGWQWLKDNLHPIPVSHIEMKLGGVKCDMTIKDPRVIKDIVAALKAKPKAYHPAKPKYNKLGGLIATLPAKAH